MSRETDIKQAADLLVETKEEVLVILSGDEHSSLSLAVGPQLQAIINRLYFMSGFTPEVITAPVDQFPPITNFMGEEIKLKKILTVEDSNPTDVERSIFLSKVENLYVEIVSLAPDGILNAYTLPEDVLVLRGVAKKAGVEGYDEKEINLAFIEAIATAIHDKENEDAEQKRIDTELAGLEKKTEGLKQTESGADPDKQSEQAVDEKFFKHTITTEDIENNPELIAQGIKVGDVVDVPVDEDEDDADQEIDVTEGIKDVTAESSAADEPKDTTNKRPKGGRK
jgi:hypothetical protein